MSTQGEAPLAWLNDDDLCAAAYPKVGPDFRSLCNETDGHTGNHRALAEIAMNYRRHVVWTVGGEVLPDEETTTSHPRTNVAGEQTPPIEGDQVT